MKKKRMRKARRNDRDEHEEFEKDFIEVSEGGSGLKKYLFIAALLMLAGYCYIGGSSKRSAAFIDDSTPGASTKKKPVKVEKQSGNVSTDAGVGKSTVNTHRVEDDSEPVMRADREVDDDDQTGNDGKAGKKKKSKKK